ncbi:MarR family winged helix-turn-helix transcriptional regulator [Hydrogenophaga sp.]|uniref:MarR family winged helix-turn-helix transcriptional regulator n=1 Tax=Hydrogenophaga sp. TaxID=1904254 RepID=UPI0025B98E26|nr:MarR family transcriptional regulator [Hydrogenophaga sp.]
MLLYRLNQLRAVGGGMVLRYCEGRFGVTRREWVMLAMLSSQARVNSSELAARAHLTRSATSKAIMAMAAKGLIERQALPGNRRVIEIRLSEAGRRLYEQILPLVEGVNRELMSSLSPQEVDALDGMLDRLQEQADVMAVHLAQLPRADRRRGGTRRVGLREPGDGEFGA